jgi:hypothetical protein
MSENKKNIPIVPIIISTVCLIVGFAIGFFVEKSRTPSFARNGQFQMAGGSNRTGAPNQKLSFKETVGEITSVDSSSITVKTADGGSKIIMMSDSTTVNQANKVDKTSLKIGTQVAVSGDQNTDGTVTGKIINITPVAVATVTPQK